MRKPSRTWALAASLLLVGTLAACGGSGDDGSGGETPSAPAPSATSDGSSSQTLGVADSDLGTILVDGQGMTIYLFTDDTQGSGASTCEGACLIAWPAVGELTAGAGVDASLLGTITRSDGTSQASYNGWPLYYYEEDTAAGDTTGQGVDGVWWVIDPQGDAIGD